MCNTTLMVSLNPHNTPNVIPSRRKHKLRLRDSNSLAQDYTTSKLWSWDFNPNSLSLQSWWRLWILRTNLQDSSERWQ